MKKALSILFVLVALVVLITYIGRGGEREEFNESEQNESDVANMSNDEVALLDGTLAFDKEASVIGWEGEKTLIDGYVDSGIISISGGEVTLSGGKITKLDVAIDMNTIEAVKTGVGAGMDKLTEHLKSADFFDVANNQQATFVLTEEALMVDGSGVAKGDLTIKGVTSPIEIPFSVSGTKERLVFNGDFTFDRTIFGANFNSGKFFQDLGEAIISDEVSMSFDLVAR